MVKKSKPLIKVKKISSSQVSKRLQSRKIQTARKVLASGASPVAKAKARRTLGI